ncbi:MAG: hypothetical protein JSV18_05040 [Candidatus Bathyarchaeota archaeon]|nr:MAG: hypothetical protein JSV18_05040 [Candidatus Bathyarchaeota archaeon]
MTRRAEGAPLAELAISMMGVVLVLNLMGLQRTPSHQEGLITWAIFSAISILGGAATLLPHRCSPTIQKPADLDPSRHTEIIGLQLVHGHHADCGKFEGHELSHSGKRFCAGCTGLLLGVIISLSVVSAYFGYGVAIPRSTGYLGLGFVVLGLGYNIILTKGPPILRLILNALLVSGFSLVLVSVDGVKSLNLMVIGLCMFWMFTRIRLSGWVHDRICEGCEEACEEKRV